MSGQAHVALLRGINVGGRNKLPMKRLVSLFETAGAEDVRHYIQSGNVVFHAKAGEVKRILTDVREGILSDFGFEPAMLSRSARQWRTLQQQNPFLSRSDDPKTLHVGFLDKKPKASLVAKLDPDRSPPDEFSVKGTELYFYCPNGLARTKLTNVYFDRMLSTVSTVRNWNTVLKIGEWVGT